MDVDRDYATGLVKRILQLEEWQEVSLVAGIDKQKFRIHRLVMAAASQYFEILLGRKFKEGKEEDVTLEGIDGQTLKSIIDFCYTGLIDINEENIDDIILAASSMELLLLEKKCSDFWAQRLRFENWVDIYIKADKYTLTELKSKIYCLICESFERVPSEDLARVDQFFFRDVLKYEKIQVPEQILFTRLQQWISHDPSERVKFVAEFIKYIRLEHLPGQFLSETVEQFCREHGCMDLIVNEYRKRVQCTGTTYLRRYPTLKNIYCAYCETTEKDNNVIIENFNPASNKLERINNISLGTPIQNFGLVMHKENLFIIGGKQDHGYRKDMESFDLRTSQINYYMPEMMVSRGFIAPLAVDGIVFVFGGFNGEAALNSCECYIIQKNEWNPLEAMHCARYAYASAVLDGYFYVAGGTGSHHTILNTVEFYDPKSDDWTHVSGMNIPRRDFALVESNGFLYAMGNNEILERYDPRQNLWTVIASFDNNAIIRSAIDLYGEIYVLIQSSEADQSGQFGKMKSENMCSVVPICSSPYRNFSHSILFFR